MIHGRGAGPENILELAPALGQPNATYLAPTAAGNTWYPYSFMTEIAKNEPFLTSALSVVGGLVSDIEAAGIGRDRIVVMGFSQGACLTTEFGIRNAARFGGFLAFSGAAIGPVGTTWATEDTQMANPFDGTPFFFGCSNVDPHIPEARVRESAQVCTRMGADVTILEVDLERMRTFGPEGVREILQDGNFGGYFQRSDEDINAIWSVAIDETRALIENW